MVRWWDSSWEGEMVRWWDSSCGKAMRDNWLIGWESLLHVKHLLYRLTDTDTHTHTHTDTHTYPHTQTNTHRDTHTYIQTHIPTSIPNQLVGGGSKNA